MRKLNLLSTLLLALLCGSMAIGQDLSNKGKDFWIPYPEHIDGTGSSMGIYITSDVNTSGSIILGSTVIPFTVTANTVVRKFLGPGGGGDAPNTGVYLGGIQDGIGVQKGIHVISQKPVVVFAHIIRSARSGAMLVLPKTVWGKEYIVPSFRNTGTSQSFGILNIMASKPNTQVEITPAAPSRNGLHAPGVPFTITLPNVGDVYQLSFQQNSDLSGTKIKSIASASSGCNPIAVFSATTWSGFPCSGASGGDNLLQQLFPLGAWGKKFLTGPLKKVATNPSDNNIDYVRVFVTDPNTQVKKTENGITNPLTGLVTPGNYYEYTTSRPTFLESDQPVQVVQYVTSQTCGNPQTQSDPEMIVLSSVEQTISDITVFSAHVNYVPPSQSDVNIHYLNVIMESSKANTFRINGMAPNASFSIIPGTVYAYLKEDLTARAATNPVFRLTADTGFSAIAYGFGQFESYGYNAGTNVKDLYTSLGSVTPHGGASTPVACAGQETKLKFSLPYQVDSIFWHINPLPGAPLDTMTRYHPPSTLTPNDSVTVVNGHNVYWYSLPRYYLLATPGTYTITLTAYAPNSDGCGTEQEFEFDVEVLPKPIADFNFTTNQCVTSPVQFTDNSQPGGRPVAKRYWDFGDGNNSTLNNPTHLYATANAYPVRYSIITDIGCASDTTEHIVELFDTPVADFTSTGPYCEGAPINFTNNSSPWATTWTWDFGDGSPTSNVKDPSHTYAAAGTYTVSLIARVGDCEGLPKTFSVTIRPKPVSNFSIPTSVCLPSGSAQFNDLSTVAPSPANTITGWSWDFGDGSPVVSGTQNPIHIYSGVGPYPVTLTVTTNHGCKDDQVLSINTIFAEPQAAFNSVPSVCIGSLIGFSQTSTAPGSTVNQWTWDFGDGSPLMVINSPANPNPSHIYAAAGTYTVTLHVRSAAGCATVNNFATRQVTVFPLPTASIALNGNAVVCKDASPAPQVTFTGIVGTAPFTFTYSINGGPDLTAVSIGNTATVTVPTGTAGTFTYRLKRVKDNSLSQCEQAQTGDVVVEVKPLPTATITGNTSVCLNAPMPTVTITGAGGTAPYTFTYKVNGGPDVVANSTGNTLTISVPTNVAGPITYSLVSVRESSANLCAQQQNGSVTVNVNALPTATISGSATEACINTTTPPSVTFTGSGGTAPYTFSYRVNGGPVQTVTTTSGNSVSVPVPTGTANTYIYTLESVLEGSSTGCSQLQSGSATVTINPLPTGDFSYTIPTCDTRTILFTDASVPNAGALNSWQWNFGDPGSGANNTSSLQNPSHTFTGTGNYDVTLTVTTDKGCQAIAYTNRVTVNARPKALFTMPQACTGDQSAPLFDGSTVDGGTIVAWEWNFGDPNANAGNPNTSTLQNPTHWFTVMGNYTIQLIATSNTGCKDTVQQTVFVNGTVLNADFQVKTTGALCSNKELVIEDASNVQGNATLLEIFWDYGNDPTVKTTVNNPTAGSLYSHTYPEFGAPATKVYQVRYVVYTGENCVNSVTRNITILATPTLEFLNVPSICSDAPSFQVTQAQMTNGLPGGPGVFSGTGISSTGMFDPVAAGAGQHIIRFTFDATNGCSNYIEQTITVNPTPGANAGPDKVVLEGGQVMLTPAQNASMPVTYTWTPPTHLNDATIAQPLASPVDDITYTLTVTSDKGCADSDEVFVKVLKAPAIPNIFSPNGDGIHDKWVIQYLETYPGCTVDIYNRYGQVVFHSVGYTTPWDGTVNGKPVPVGTYYYIVNPKNGRGQMSGYVDVIR